MIISALYKYYDILKNDNSVNISPYGFAMTKVDYCAVLSEKGELKSLINLRALNDNKPQLLLMPKRMKTSSISSSPVCDNFAYIFGVEGKGGVKNINEKKFQTAKELHLEIFSSVLTTHGKVICEFFKSWNIEHAWDNEVLMEHYSPKGDAFMGNIVFKLENEEVYFHNCPEIIDAWIDANEKSQKEETPYIAQCAITGEMQTIAKLHDQVSGVNGANTTGTSLICFNKDSDISYNMDKSYNSAVSEMAMFKYTTALQYLLSNTQQKLSIGIDTVVFWAESCEKVFTTFPNMILKNPTGSSDESEDKETLGIVQAVLSDGKRGILNHPQIKPKTKFYILGLSPNAGRISVRYFYNNTFDEFCEKVKKHYDDISIYGGVRAKKYISIGSLLYGTIRSESKDKKVNPLLGGSVMRAILSGNLYPNILYNQLIIRTKVESKITYARAGGIKGYLIRKARINEKKEEIFMYLNEETTNSAYVLGRTFAILEMIQKKAIGESINVTIKDKYFSSACSNPALVFPNLLKLAQHHLAKIDGNYWSIKLGKCLGKINSDELPKTMNMDNQGRFILGYYQQVQKLYEKNEGGRVNEQ